MDEETVTANRWTEAAEGYGEIVRKQLNSDERKVWLDLVYRYAPKKDRLKVLDIGPSSVEGVPNYGLCSFKENIGCTISLRHVFQL